MKAMDKPGFGVGNYQNYYRDEDGGIDAEEAGVDNSFTGLGILGGRGSQHRPGRR